MGLPAVQLVMIAARQVSKPIAEAIIAYGKGHPLFRNRILIPVGRSLVHLTTRLRMRRLGLGSPTSVATVSEAAALEQASDFIQQVVLFSYSVGVFAGYYYYTKLTSPETMKMEDFEKWKEEAAEEKETLQLRIKRLEDVLVSYRYKLPPLPERPKKVEGIDAAKAAPPPPPPSSTPPAEVTAASNGAAKESAPTAQPSVKEPLESSATATPLAMKSKESSTVSAPSPTSSESLPALPDTQAASPVPSSPPPPPPRRFPLISSLPLDKAQRLILEDEVFTVCVKGTSVSLEMGDPVSKSLRFAPIQRPAPGRGFIRLSERALGYITGGPR